MDFDKFKKKAKIGLNRSASHFAKRRFQQHTLSDLQSMFGSEVEYRRKKYVIDGFEVRQDEIIVILKDGRRSISVPINKV